MLKRIAIAVVAVILIVPEGSFVHACSCASQSQKNAFIGSDAVFEGQVVKKELRDEIWHVTLRVMNAWKGVKSNLVTVDTAQYGSLCGYGFGVGRVYLVYAFRRVRKGGQLWTTICSRTCPIARANADLKALGVPIFTPTPSEIPASLQSPAPPKPTASPKTPASRNTGSTDYIAVALAVAVAIVLIALITGRIASRLISWMAARRKRE